MAGSWEGLCRAKDLQVDGSQIQVRFADGRGHRVTVGEDGEAYGLSASRSYASVNLIAIPGLLRPVFGPLRWPRSSGADGVGKQASEPGTPGCPGASAVAL